MVGILVATHGKFAEGLLNAVELIAGKQEKAETIGLCHGDGIGEFEDRIKMLIRELDDGDGVLVFVDILGGSPANTVMKCFSMEHDIRAIAGVNMGMLVQAVMMREVTDLQELCDICEEEGKKDPVLLHKRFEELMAEAAEMDNEI